MLSRILKNWRLTMIAIFFFCLFCRLGFWQLQRANEKTTLLQQYNERIHTIPLNIKTLDTQHDWQFYPIHLAGYFDNQHTLLLDNKTQDNHLGYEIYTPFITADSKKIVLIDRGFIQATSDRHRLPQIKSITQRQSLTGLLMLPPAYFALGPMRDTSITFPLRVEYINLNELSRRLPYQLFPYVVRLTPSPAALGTQQALPFHTLSPEKHRAYALQWFAFALTLLILFTVLNRRQSS